MPQPAQLEWSASQELAPHAPLILYLLSIYMFRLIGFSLPCGLQWALTKYKLRTLQRVASLLFVFAFGMHY